MLLLGMSGNRLARLAGVTPGCVSHWRRGLQRPTRRTCVKLAAALGVGLDEVWEPRPKSDDAERKKKVLRERYAVLRGGKICTFCKRAGAITGPKGGTTVCVGCVEKRREKSSGRRRVFKSECLEAYGGAVCACCGERGLEFLTIDHINGDGAGHRRQIGLEVEGKATKSHGSRNFYWWLKLHNWPPGFQVLCMNCNWAKKSKSHCPHKDRKVEYLPMTFVDWGPHGDGDVRGASEGGVEIVGLDGVRGGAAVGAVAGEPVEVSAGAASADARGGGEAGEDVGPDGGGVLRLTVAAAADWGSYSVLCGSVIQGVDS